MVAKGTTNIGFVVVFHPFEDGAGNAETIRDESVDYLSQLGMRVQPAPCLVNDARSASIAGQWFKERGIEAIVVQLATWSDDNLLLDMLAYHDVPVIIWSLKDMNSGSLCGGQQFNMVLKELGKKSCIIFDHPDNFASRIEEFLQASTQHLPAGKPESKTGSIEDLIEGFRHLKVGIIGARTQGMMEVAFDEFSIKEILGPSIIALSLDLLKQRARDVDDHGAVEWVTRFVNGRPGMRVNVPDDILLQSAKTAIALHDLVKENDLGAITIECYPRFMGEVCVGLSMLADEGIATACEGDVHAAIIAWLLQRLSGKPTNHIDVLDVDFDENTVTGGHCGCCSTTLADRAMKGPTIDHVRLAGTGACILFPHARGPVTMINLVGRKGTYRACIVEGEVIPKGMVFPGNPATVRLKGHVKSFLLGVEARGFGHHWILCQGHGHIDVVSTLLARLGVDVVNIS